MNYFPQLSRRELVLLLIAYFIIETLIRYFSLFYVTIPLRTLSLDLKLEPITVKSFLLYNATLNFIGDCARLFIISIVIYVGALSYRYSLKWTDSLRIVLISSFCLVGVDVVKLGYLSLVEINNLSQLADIEGSFSLFIIADLLPIGEGKFLTTFLKEITVNQVLFILVLSYGVELYISNMSFSKGLKFVASTYGAAYLFLALFLSLIASLF